MAFIKVLIVAVVCYGTYVAMGYYLPTTHHFAFGVAGLGFTYLALATMLAGAVTAKVVS